MLGGETYPTDMFDHAEAQASGGCFATVTDEATQFLQAAYDLASSDGQADCSFA